jgi:hypothetical protein
MQDFLAIVNAGMHQQNAEKERLSGARRKK